MAVEIIVPTLGESISEATVLNWRKSPGDPVARSEIIVELETDKVTVEVEAPEDGVLLEIAAGDGEDVEVGAVIARISTAGPVSAEPVTAVDAAGPPDAAPDPEGTEVTPFSEPPALTAEPTEPGNAGPGPATEPASGAPEAESAAPEGTDISPFSEPPAPAPEPAGPESAGLEPASRSAFVAPPGALPEGSIPDAEPDPGLPDPTGVRRSGRGDRITVDDLREFLGGSEQPLSPAARRVARELAVDPAVVTPTGPSGRLLKEDILAAAHEDRDSSSALSGPIAAPEATMAVAQSDGDLPADGLAAATPPGRTETADPGSAPQPPLTESEPSGDSSARVRRVPMSRLRRRIAERLKEAQNTAAMLTTYNEVDMSTVMELRKTSGETFEARHGVRLGLMSFFVKASVSALRAVPEVNAEIEGTDIVYKDFYDIGVAVGSERGLVVPVLRGVDRKSFADIEREIRSFSERANSGGLSADDLEGGTFTISNGGVYGSLMSAPILNPPQSGILGLHRIQERPVARNGHVVIRPMMYLALSYDHRIVDGQGAVTFLVHLRDLLEQPASLALDT